MSEIYYSIVLPGESVKSKYQVQLANKDLKCNSETGDIQISDDKFISSDRLDEILIITLYKQDFMEISDFLDFHLVEYKGDKLWFLKKTKYVIDNYFASGYTVYDNVDYSLQPHIENPKTNEIYNWFDKWNQEYDITNDKTSLKKLKWLGTPSQFGWVFLELADKGFIELPKTGGQDSHTKYANYCFGIFDIDTTPGNLIKEMNPKSNSLTFANRNEFTFPEISKLSKSK